MTAPVARRGFTEAAVAELIARRAEPEWMRERRLDAWQTYQRIPMPTRQDEEWRRADLRRLKLDDVQPYSDDRANAGGTLLPEAEREEQLAGFLGLRTAQRTEFRIKESLVEKGVIFTDLASAVRDHGELVRACFMTRCVPARASPFAALPRPRWA